MKFSPPQKIKIKSDDNILLFISVTKVGYKYRYIESEFKLNTDVEYTEEYLRSMLTYSFEILEAAKVEEVVAVEEVKEVVQHVPIVAEKGADKIIAVKKVKPKNNQGSLF